MEEFTKNIDIYHHSSQYSQLPLIHSLHRFGFLRGISDILIFTVKKNSEKTVLFTGAVH